MRQSFTRALQQHGVWVSVLLHFLFLMSFSLVFVRTLPHDNEKKPGLDIPAYVYKPDAKTLAKSQPSAKSKPVMDPPEEKPALKSEIATKANTSDVRTAKQYTTVNASKSSEPVHLIGDKTVSKPLLTLLGKALSAKLVYPKIAVDFKIKGVVLVGFLLHPDGQITDTEVVESSEKGVLDEEAFAAVKAMSPVKNVGEFLKEPKYLVVGVIFG